MKKCLAAAAAASKNFLKAEQKLNEKFPLIQLLFSQLHLCVITHRFIKSLFCKVALSARYASHFVQYKMTPHRITD